MLLMASCTGNAGESSSQNASSDSSATESSQSSVSSKSSEEPVKKYSIKSLTALGGINTTNYVTASGVTVGAEYDSGTDVTLTFTAGLYLSTEFTTALAKNIYVYVNGEVYHPTYDAKTTTMALTFKMPGKDAEIEYCYTTNNSGLTWSFKNLGNYVVRGIDLAQKYQYAYFYLVGPEDEIITSLAYETDTGAKGDFTSYLTDVGNGTYYASGLGISSDDGSTTMTLTLATSKATSQKITYVGLDNEKVDTANSILPTTGYVGKQTTITVKAAEGYTLSLMTFSDSTIYPINGSATFTMPADELTVTLSFGSGIKASDVTFSYVGATAEVVEKAYFLDTSSNEVNTLEPGNTYYLRVQLNSGEYMVSSAKLNGGFAVAASGVTYPKKIENCYQAMATIPAGTDSLAVEVTLSKAYTVTIPTVEGLTVNVSAGYILLSNGSKVAAGTSISAYAYTADASYNYTYYTLKVLDASNADISTEVGLTGDSSYYSFTMPEKNITLSFSAPVVENEYTSVAKYDFSTWGSTNSTQTKEKVQALFDGGTYLNSGTNIVSTVDSVSNVAQGYQNSGISGFRMGTSKNKRSVALTLSQNINKVSLTIQNAVNTNTPTVSVGDLTYTCTAGDATTPTTQEFEFSEATNSITISKTAAVVITVFEFFTKAA